MRAAAAIVWMLAGWGAGMAGASAGGLGELAPWLGRLEGGLRGVYTPVEGRSLVWSVAWAPGAGPTRRGEVVAAGPDLALRVALVFDPEGNRLEWRVTEGRVDLGAWLSALAARPEWAEEWRGMTAAGVLTITGEGGVSGGTLQASWIEGTSSHAGQGWTLDGVSIRAGGPVAELEQGRVPVEVAVRTITTARFGARALNLRAVLVDFARLEVESAEVEIAGGKVRTGPFAVALSEPKLAVDLSMERVGLQDVAALIPDFLAEGRGRVNGALRISWSEAAGVSLGDGFFSIDPGERAEVRFRPNPGLLTGSLPPDILKHYPGLTNVEMGRVSLLAERFDVRLSPEGDEAGRTATVNLAGGPVDRSLKAPLVLTINVRGPLAPLIKFGSTPGLRIGGGE